MQKYVMVKIIFIFIYQHVIYCIPVTQLYISSIQRELVGIVKKVLTDRGLPFLYLLNDLEQKEIKFKFHHDDLRTAPRLQDIKFDVQSVLQKDGDKWKVTFQYYSR